MQREQWRRCIVPLRRRRRRGGGNPRSGSEPPPVIPSLEEVTISIMMLDESDRDLIATRLAVLEASAEDIIWVCAEAMCNCT